MVCRDMRKFKKKMSRKLKRCIKCSKYQFVHAVESPQMYVCVLEELSAQVKQTVQFFLFLISSMTGVF